MWIYKTEYNADGEVVKCIAQFIAKGYAQKKGIEFDKTLTLVARWDTLHIVIALVAHNRWRFRQMDVQFVVLKGVLA